MKCIIADIGKKVTKKESMRLFEAYYEQETGEKVRYSDLLKKENGKPYLKNGRKFNISHSGQYWCMAIGEKELGIDIEVRRKIRPEMARRILALNEKAVNSDLLYSWVLKEAYAKMLGEGLKLDFRTITVEEIMKRCVIENYSSEKYICFAVGLK